MNHDGSQDCACGTEAEPCCAVASQDAAMSARTAGGLDVKPERDSRPFVAQDGQCLYLVASTARGWVVAELEFDPESCVFVLKRQTEYEWPREALGRLLSRVISPQSVDDQEMYRMSDAFTDWLATQFAA
jgi:hypothetical protein